MLTNIFKLNETRILRQTGYLFFNFSILKFALLWADLTKWHLNVEPWITLSHVTQITFACCYCIIDTATPLHQCLCMTHNRERNHWGTGGYVSLYKWRRNRFRFSFIHTRIKAKCCFERTFIYSYFVSSARFNLGTTYEELWILTRFYFVNMNDVVLFWAFDSGIQWNSFTLSGGWKGLSFSH